MKSCRVSGAAVASLPVRRKSCGKACRAFKGFRAFFIPGPGSRQRWAYDRYDEGMAVLVYHPLRIRTSFRSSRSFDYHYWKTRRVLGIRTGGRSDTWFYTVHWRFTGGTMRKTRLAGQWEQLNQFLQEKGRILDSGKNVWLLGDFNSPSAVSGEGYDCIRKAGWPWILCSGSAKDDGATVDHVIDGRRTIRWQKGRNCRLDYMFSRNPVRSVPRVICMGPLSGGMDHFGVMVTVSERSRIV